MIKKLVLASLFLMTATAAAQPLFSAEKYKLSPEDRKYLETLMKATWDYCDYYIAPQTGFPYDSNTPAKDTNTTNIGLYLADLAVAHHLGYVTKEHAIARVRKILDSLNKIENWNGLYKNILDTEGETKAKPGESNISDYNKLPAGVIMIKQEIPELNKECTAFLNRINWSVFYAPSIDGIYYAYDVANKKPLYPVHISRGEDKLLGAFMTVASGGVPASTWDHHALTMEDRYGFKYLQPGWNGGGLFMQFICGIFLDERGTVLGYSAANFAFAQIVHAEYINSPVWGWSASFEPDGGYLGFNSLKDEVITPHASALAIELFPEHSIRNLKRLEKLGARPKQKAGGKERDFGFRDAYNTQMNIPTQCYLVLDQSMLFLSLANFLEDGIVRKIFAKDPVVQNGYRILNHYKISASEKKKFDDYISSLSVPVCSINVSPVNYKESYNPGDKIELAVTLNNFTNKDISSGRFSWKFTDAAKGSVIASGEKILDLLKGASAELDRVACVIPADISRKSGVSFEASLHDSKSREIKNYSSGFSLMDYFDMKGQWLFQTGDTAAWSSAAYNDKKWAKIKVPGIWEDQGYEGYDGLAWYRHHFTIPDNLYAEWGESDLMMEFGSIDDADQVFVNGKMIGATGSFPPKPETGYGKNRLYPVPAGLIKRGADNVVAVRIHDSMGNGGIYKGPAKIAPSSAGTIMRMDTTAGWDPYTDNGATASLGTAQGNKGKALEFTYNLGAGNWAAMRKFIEGDISKYTSVSFSYKGSGAKNTLEVKFEDADGSVFGTVIGARSNPSAWTDITIPIASLSYWWGGDKTLDLKKVKLHFAVSKRDGDAGGTGKLIIGDIGAFSYGSPGINKAAASSPAKPSSVKIDSKLEGWEVYKDNSVDIALLPAKGKTGDAVEMDYDLASGAWFGAKKEFKGDFTGFKGLRFVFRGEGNPNSVEVKIEDKDGSNFGKILPIKSNIKNWTTINLPFSALEHWSGSDNKLDLSGVKLHFAVSVKDKNDKGGKGKFIAGNIEFIK